MNNEMLQFFFNGRQGQKDFPDDFQFFTLGEVVTGS